MPLRVFRSSCFLAGTHTGAGFCRSAHWRGGGHPDHRLTQSTTDNGYKVYIDGGIQIISPTDHEIETAIAGAPFADQIGGPVVPADSGLVELYIQRAARVRRSSGSVRVALTPLHGVGGALAVETLRRAGFDDVHTVASQFNPDPDFPTVGSLSPKSRAPPTHCCSSLSKRRRDCYRARS